MKIKKGKKFSVWMILCNLILLWNFLNINRLNMKEEPFVKEKRNMKIAEQDKFWIWLLVSMSCLYLKLAETLPEIDLKNDQIAFLLISMVVIGATIIIPKHSSIIDNFIMILFNLLIFSAIPMVNWTGGNHLATIIADSAIIMIIIGGFLKFFLGKDLIISPFKEWDGIDNVFQKFPDKRLP